MKRLCKMPKMYIASGSIIMCTLIFLIIFLKGQIINPNIESLEKVLPYSFNYTDLIKKEIEKTNYINIAKKEDIKDESDSTEIYVDANGFTIGLVDNSDIHFVDNSKKDNTLINIGNVSIKKFASKNVDFQKLYNANFNITYSKKDVDILVYHTHTSESYKPSPKYQFPYTDTFRTEDGRYNMARVGEELVKELKNNNINGFQDRTVHDYPSYTGSYERSLKTIESDFKKYNKAQIVLDLHRDALGGDFNFAPKIKINNDQVAQIMIVAGCNEMGLESPHWEKNLQFAIALQKKGNEMYPGLFKTLQFRKERFNQNVSNNALIIEVGATGNTLDESIGSMKYLAKVLAAL